FSDTAQDSARGAEIWVRESDAKSRALAKQVNKQLTGLKGMKSRGLKDEADAPLSLMEYTDIPTILVEAGFLSNDGDLSYLKSEKNQEAMAKAIADGIVHAFDKES
ncbi:N-acetylmuramoyl-L-alanine amidase, partial [[Clostridium] innocuum]|nr:N-acetylmuramoyl-L-alanine amidase [[Clostridium] innocuum]